MASLTVVLPVRSTLEEDGRSNYKSLSVQVLWSCHGAPSCSLCLLCSLLFVPFCYIK